MNSIEVISTTEVKVNNSTAGRVCDVLSNYPKDIAAIQAGLEKFEQGLKQSLQEERKNSANIEATVKKTNALLDEVQADKLELSKEIAQLKVQLAEASRLLSLPERQRLAELHEVEAAKHLNKAAELRA